MGVITCTAPMNPTGDVTYTHKKFKRAASEACDSADQQKQQQPQPQQQVQPKQTQPLQQEVRKHHDKTVVVESGARTTAITTSGGQINPINGHLPAQLNSQLTSNVGGHFSSDGDEVKRKSIGNGGGGKYKCQYCGVLCAKPSVLGKHIRTHTNERPYSCDQCQIAFKTKSNYLKHTKSRAHVVKCDGVAKDDGLFEASDSAGDGERGRESPRCPILTDTTVVSQVVQNQPADLSVTRPSRDLLFSSSVAPTPRLPHHQEELTKDRGKSLYKPKFRAQYSLRDESGVPKGNTPPPPPPLLGHQPAPHTPHDVSSQLECNPSSNPATYQPHAASNSSNSHSSPGQYSSSASPAQFPKQQYLPPLDIHATAAANNKKEDLALLGQKSSSVVTPSSANTLWKGMKSPSPEVLGQHITKLIVENQAIVETHNPLWSKRYRRQSSLGSSSSESDGSGSGKSRRCSLVETSSKNTKLSSAGTPPVNYGSGQTYPRERIHSLTGEALMIEPRSSYSPSLPPTPHLPLAQPPVTLISASKPSISSHGHTTTSYSQSDPAFATSHIGILELNSTEGSRKRTMSEGLGVVRDLPKGRVHSKNPEGSVIKNLLLNARANITCALDQQNIERLEQSRIASQNAIAPPPDEGVQHIRSLCKTSPENLEFNARQYSGHRHGGSGSERGTPDSLKSGGDGGRWSGEQDVALDLQKKDRADPYEHERSSSRGSSISIGESSQRRGSDEDIRYRPDLSPRIYGNEVTCDVVSPVTKKRKMSEAESTIHDKSMFLSPVFSPKGQVGKNESSMKMMEEISKHKPSSRHFFGGEVQICDGKNLKTMRIDPSQQPSPTLDICIPPQQLGVNIARSEVSVPTSVVVTIAKSGLNSGGTMVQVESQMSTSSTKTAPSLVNSILPQDQPPRVDPSRHPSKPPPHPPNMYPADAPPFPFSPSFYQYAPLLPLPNLTIPGIPTPDLGDLSYPMNPPNASNQPFLHGGQAPPPTQKQNAPHSPVSHPRAGIQSPVSHPRASVQSPLSHPRAGVQSPLSHPRAGVQSPLSHPRAGVQSPLSHPRAGIQSPLSHPRAATIQSTISHPRVSLTLSQAITSGPLACVTAGMPMQSGPKVGPLGGPSTIMMREKEKEHHRKPSSYPALIPMGNEKVPYVPGIPGPYSQAGSVVQSQSAHSMQKSPLAVFTPPVPAPSLSPATSKAHLASAPSPVPLMMTTEGKEKHLTIPRLREISRESPKNQVKDLNQFTDSPKYPTKIVSHVSPKDIHGPVDRTKLSVTPVKPSEVKSVNPEIRIHPVISSPHSHQEKRELEKNQIQGEALDSEELISESSSIPKDFLPPRKRPNSLALKPQPYMPKSDALIGTILVSPDTPRPKKSCVQMLLNGSAYTYLGHKVSTKSYFCCIYRQQPMYVPQSTDPKLSMYSNWQIRKPAEDNPFELTPYQSLGLYESRKYNHAYTIAKEKELNLIQTHSSYWTFKEENEKNKEKEKEDSNSKTDEKDIKIDDSPTEASEPSTAETSSTSVKREPEDQSNDFSSKSEDGDGFDGSAKRIKIFEGGFKSTEEYTYVRGRGRGRYVCGACGIRCKKPSMLKKHIRTHTDLRPYACGHCSFSFKTKGNLTKHLRSKAHYKRCVEMGVVPVPTVVDESHVNEEALALQGKMEQERIDEEDDDDDGDDDDDDDEEIDEDEEDDEAMDEDQFEDAEDLKEFRVEEETVHGKDKEGSQPLKDTKDSRDVITHATTAVSRAGVLVMLPSVNNSLGSCNQGSGEGKLSSSVSSVDSSTRDSPIDLSVKKLTVSSNSTVQEKSVPIKKPSVPARPNFLPLLSKSSVGDLRSPVGNLVSPGTPSTPIREHPSEILSPVTESSTLLKSIYNTTLRISNVSSGEMQSIVPDPTKENGCNSSMLHTYLKERAMVDTTFKRQQYKSSSSDTSPDSPQANSARVPSESAKSTGNDMSELPLSKPETTASNVNAKVIVDDCKRDGKGDAAASQASSIVEQNQTSMPSSVGSSSTITLSSASSAITSRMPTPPANLTVMNSGGMDKTAFLVPSGVVPSSLNRLGNDDGKCKCSICHKEFNKQSQLSIHMNIHYMERPYRCDSCAVSFRTNGHLQKHKRSLSHYNKVNMNMTFGTPSTDNPRPFKCHDCKIAFRIHGHLAKHLRSKMHIMKLECLGKLPFGTYAEIERSGANLNEIDTTDCDNSLESLQSMATRLYEKEPSKLAAWRNQQDTLHHRVRTVSNSSTNSDDYPLQDEQDDPLSGCGNDEDTEGDDDEELPVPHEAAGRIGIPSTVLGPSPRDSHSPQSNALQTIEIGSQQLTQPVVHPFTCGLCEAKFSSHSQLIIHSQQNCTVKSS